MEDGALRRLTEECKDAPGETATVRRQAAETRTTCGRASLLGLETLDISLGITVDPFRVIGFVDIMTYDGDACP